MKKKFKDSILINIILIAIGVLFLSVGILVKNEFSQISSDIDQSYSVLCYFVIGLGTIFIIRALVNLVKRLFF